MPWLSARIERKLANFHRAAWALVFMSGCFFNADYGGGHYTCSDNICPTGLICDKGECVSEVRKDAAIDTMSIIDGPVATQTCIGPQLFPSTGGMTAGSTTGHPNNVASMCAGSIQNGVDVVYKIQDATSPILITVTGNFAVTAYALTACTANEACVSNKTAVPGSPISVPAGSYFIVVDSANAAMSGTYTLNLVVQ